MNTYILRGELGFNTFFIKNNIPGMSIITKEDPLPAFTDNDHVIRWGTTRLIPNGPKVINRTKAIKETSQKGMFRKKVADAGHSVPTFTNIADYLKSVKDFVPVIVRPLHHERSEGLYFCNSIGELGMAIDKIGPEFYISEYVAKDAEYRVFIAQGRPFVVAEKNPADKKAITWGCVDEGTFDYIAWEDWPTAVVENAVASFNLSKLDFAAIDIMVKDGKAYFLEANTAPEVLNYYGTSFAKVFKHMFEYLSE